MSDKTYRRNAQTVLYYCVTRIASYPRRAFSSYRRGGMLGTRKFTSYSDVYETTIYVNMYT